MHGDFDPAFITTIVDQPRLEPARGRIAEELLRWSGRPFRTDYWAWKSRNELTADLRHRG